MSDARKISTAEFFDSHVSGLHEYRLNIMGSKGTREYASDDDRLINFKDDERISGVGAATCLMIMMNKHIRAVQGLIRKIEQKAAENPELSMDEIINDLQLTEPFEGRVADIMNYLDLLMSMLISQGYHPSYYDPRIFTE